LAARAWSRGMQRAEVAYRTVPDVITDAALLLWSLTKSLMDALFAPTPDPVPMAPENHQLVEHLLLRLHTVFTKVHPYSDVQDAELGGGPLIGRLNNV